MNLVSKTDTILVVRERLIVSGRVQGVGFRPSVARIATDLGLVGFVKNRQHTVEIQIEGASGTIGKFVDRLCDLPLPVQIQTLERESLAVNYDRKFVIITSDHVLDRNAFIPQDLAPCSACVAELFNPSERRFRYPFISCAVCGPRFSLIEKLPFDRVRTAMADFPLCDLCLEEYSSPLDRRFHAQTISCPVCGPRISWLDQYGHQWGDGEEAIAAALAILSRGGIVGVKGVGGYQFLTAADNACAVARLRTVKQRPFKPLAIMLPNTDAAGDYVVLSKEIRSHLESPQCPIVLAPKLASPLSEHLAHLWAPSSRYIGVMLPSSPLHLLLAKALNYPLVITSANLPGEPIAAEERELTAQLKCMADGWLMHNRRIVNRCDDSVMMVSGARPRLVRLGRGFAPTSLPHVLPSADGILAVGGQQRNCVAIADDRAIVVSPHVGDIGNASTFEFMHRSSDMLARLVGVRPSLAACDQHPGYDSIRLAEGFDRSLKVQHHVAHAWSVVAEHGLVGPLLAMVWDGTGYGMDGTMWGGEFIVIDGASWRRVGRFRPFPLPGGELAAKEPRRSGLGVLVRAFGVHSIEAIQALEQWFSPYERSVLKSAMLHSLNTPLSSSVGRLFDAAAALSGVCLKASYQDHAPSALEASAIQSFAPSHYSLDLVSMELASGMIIEVDWLPLVSGILSDLEAAVPIPDIAAGFHAALADAGLKVAQDINLKNIVLSGGVFNNDLLATQLNQMLTKAGFSVFTSEQIPAGDGGLCVGQAAYALVSQLKEGLRCV